MVEFGKLDEQGRYTRIKSVEQSDMLKCQHCIMVAEHYRDDGTCRCNDPDHREMEEWGYTWNDGRWQ